ncbi:hypothetical protein [Citreimonas salinaria]|uniref:AAA+ family ATPase n=1 Tax=Citreimonas salinaria TaxID=321339 RepID=A0A1H3K015_9RHOB|nr:hypothetical protein [Citreimonas salinaria]SDY45516.1 hypothetical protein SAMN05444340_10887 [Citreimonas salinaria]
MTRIAAFALTALLSATPLAAQEPLQDQPVPEPSEESESFRMMEEGARTFFRGLMGEMEPALEGLQGMTEQMRPALRDFVAEMGPAFRDLMTEVEDWSVYHAPEILPNGDIIIRRREPLEDAPDGVPDIAPGTEPQPDSETGEIEL